MASQLDILTKRPLSGPLASRSLTSQSGRMKNASRSLRRQGFAGAASDMAMGAEMAKLNEINARGGRNIRSADEEESLRRYEVRSAAAAAMQRERSQMPEAGGIGVQGATRNEGATPSAGGTAGQDYRSEVAGRVRNTISKNGWDQPAPPAAQPAGSIKIDASGAAPAAGGTPAPGPVIPPLLRRPEAPRAGVINGVQVGDKESTIERVRQESATSLESRRSILDRINQERATVGQKPIEIDWAKDVAPRDIREGDASTREVSKAAGERFMGDEKARNAIDAAGIGMTPKRPAAATPALAAPSLLSRPTTPLATGKPASNPQLVSESDQLSRAKKKREETNALLKGRRQSERAAITDDSIPEWLRGTIVGGALKAIQKPTL